VISRVGFPIRQDTIWSALGANVLWTLFQPWHVYTLATLTPTTPGATPEKAAIVAADVASRIAAELGLSATGWTTRDKATRSAQAKACGKERWLARMRDGSSR